MASLLDDNIYFSFEMDSHIKGYHDYKDTWTPSPNEMLKAVPEPTNVVDKYAVCVLIGEVIVGHLKKGKTGRFKSGRERLVCCYRSGKSGQPWGWRRHASTLYSTFQRNTKIYQCSATTA